MILKINDRIKNRKLETFTEVHVTLKYDSVASTFQWKFNFDPTDQDQVDVCAIGHYHLCTLEHKGELIITGQIMSQFFHDEPVPQTATLSGYSLPGVIEDCEIPAELYPLQSDLLSLREIATRYLKPFGIGFDVDQSVASRMDKPYEECSATMGQSLKSYLAELASQKNIILSHTRKGRLLFTQPQASQKPITHFSKTGTPWTRMTTAFDGQAMHSRIYVVTQADKDDVNTSESFSDNPLVLNNVFRQKIMVLNSGDREDNLDSGGGSKASRNMLCKELKSHTLDIGLDRWDINGKIVRPGDIVSVTNPNAYQFKKTNWFVEEVELVASADEERATLRCVLPSVYNGTTPTNPYAGINLR